MSAAKQKLLYDEKFYSKLNPYLEFINEKTVKINGENRKLCVKTAMYVVGTLVEKLKNKDPVFKWFYNKITYVGSFYDGLRVSEATEFDLNLLLKLPCDVAKIKIENNSVPCGFVRVNVNDAIDKSKLNDPARAKVWNRWIDERGYIQHDKVLRWLESAFTKISDNGKHLITVNEKDVEVTISKNGPAFTLHIPFGKTNIDVDLVPAIGFPSTMKPPSPIRWTDSMEWVVIPKPSDDVTIWRLSFPAQEQKLMGDSKLSHLKYTNKLLKRFRDAIGLKLPSYFIKTLFLWESHHCQQRNDDVFWKKPPSYLFPYMLMRLAEVLEKKTLSYYWHKGMNLFQPLPPKPCDKVLLENMEGRVKNVLKKLNAIITQDDKTKLKQYTFQIFGVDSSDELIGNISKLNLTQL